MHNQQLNKSTKPLIIAHNVSFEPRIESPIIKNITASFSNEKTGLVGKNGVGKTTLLKLLIGELEPTEGKIESNSTAAYLPQDLHPYLAKTVSEISETLHRHPEFIPMKSSILDTVGISGTLLNETIHPERTLESLSGGERMKVLLSSLIAQNPDFLILDEPTNNLDREARHYIYELIENWKGGLLVVSHDRTLLNLMDRTLELSEFGLKEYGGNYTFYKEQKDIENQAAQHHLEHSTKELKKTKKLAQDVQERQSKRSIRGEKSNKEDGVPKIILGWLKRHAEESSGKLKDIHQEKLMQAKDNVAQAKQMIRPENEIRVDLSRTSVPNGKLVLDMKEVSFGYNDNIEILENLNLALYGPERLSLAGPNGSGKTTLVKLILQELHPAGGEIKVGVEYIAYLDQHTQVLGREKTLFDNFEIKLPRLSDVEVRQYLGRFLFHNQDVFKKVSDLSGGEKMRASLAYILAGDTPPQLLILDEPTNNLDLNTIEQIESALSNYQGALIVISHDQSFLENIGVTKVFELS